MQTVIFITAIITAIVLVMIGIYINSNSKQVLSPDAETQILYTLDYF